MRSGGRPLEPEHVELPLDRRPFPERDSGLRVRVYWYGLLNQLLGYSDFGVFPGGGNWGPTGKVQSGGGLLAPLPVVSLLSSSSARIQITPLGSGSRWQIDDLYIDPSVMRIG